MQREIRREKWGESEFFRENNSIIQTKRGREERRERDRVIQRESGVEREAGVGEGDRESFPEMIV